MNQMNEIVEQAAVVISQLGDMDDYDDLHRSLPIAEGLAAADLLRTDSVERVVAAARAWALSRERCNEPEYPVGYAAAVDALYRAVVDL